MLGCAILAAAAAQLHPDIATAVEKMVHVDRVVHPDQGRHAQYQKLYQEYRELYPALAPIFHGRHSTAADNPGVREVAF